MALYAEGGIDMGVGLEICIYAQNTKLYAGGGVGGDRQFDCVEGEVGMGEGKPCWDTHSNKKRWKLHIH